MNKLNSVLLVQLYYMPTNHNHFWLCYQDLLPWFRNQACRATSQPQGFKTFPDSKALTPNHCKIQLYLSPILSPDPTLLCFGYRKATEERKPRKIKASMCSGSTSSVNNWRLQLWTTLQRTRARVMSVILPRAARNNNSQLTYLTVLSQKPKQPILLKYNQSQLELPSRNLGNSVTRSENIRFHHIQFIGNKSRNIPVQKEQESK